MGRKRRFWKRLLGLLGAAVAYTVMTASVGIAQTDPEEDAPTRRSRTEPAAPILPGMNLPLILLPDAPLNAGAGATPAPRDVTESPLRPGLPPLPLPDAPLNAGSGATPAPRDVTESPLRPRLLPLPLPVASGSGGSDPDATGGDFGEAVRIELVYTEVVSDDEDLDDKVSDGCDINSLISGVNCVTKAMDGPQAGGGLTGGDGPPAREKTFGSRLSVPVKPVVLTVDEGKIYYLWLDVGAPRLHIPRDMPAESLRSARRDATFVLSRLKKWTRSLTGDTAERFGEQNRVTIRMISPFKGLEKLRLVKPARVNFQIGPTPEIRLRFVRMEDERFVRLGGPAVHGEPFFLEALFENPEEDRFSYDVEVTWASGDGKFVTVSRSDNNPKLFRSKPIYLGSLK